MRSRAAQDRKNAREREMRAESRRRAGLPPAPAAHNRKLTPGQVAAIRRLGGHNHKGQGRKAEHPTHVKLGAIFGVPPSCVGEILAGRTYREVIGGR